MDMATEMDMETETAWKWKRKLIIHGHGHGIWELLLSIPYGAIVPIVSYGMPLKYQGAISNGAIYL
jgi:hypothetical protein